MFLPRSLAALLLLVPFLGAAFHPAEAQAPCKAPKAVCAVAERVFMIASFEPLASAVLIEPGLLVTNRHVIADNERAQVFLPSGTQVLATVVPSSYGGDLILLKVPELKAPGPMVTAKPSPGEALYTVGADVGREAIRVYKPGRQLLAPAEGKPLARLHHDAFSQPGNSGGALVNADGRLVAVVTSGGEGRNEAIPATEITKLKALSGPGHRAVSRATGEAYRKCGEAIESAQATRQRLEPRNVAFITEHCIRTGNRQLLDLAGQAFGRQHLIKDALVMFRWALDQDPNAINSMISIAIVLHLDGRYAEEVPYLRRLVSLLPSDLQVLRLGIQAGAWGGDKALMERSLELLGKHHPKLAPLARDFIENNPTPPRRPSPRPNP